MLNYEAGYRNKNKRKADEMHSQKSSNEINIIPQHSKPAKNDSNGIHLTGEKNTKLNGDTMDLS